MPIYTACIFAWRLSRKDTRKFFFFLWLFLFIFTPNCYGFFEAIAPKFDPLSINTAISTSCATFVNSYESTNLIHSDSLNLNRNMFRWSYTAPLTHFFVDQLGIDYQQSQDCTEINETYNLTLIQEMETIQTWGHRTIGPMDLTLGLSKSSHFQFPVMLPFTITLKPISTLELGFKRTLSPLDYSIHYYLAEDNRDEYATFQSFGDAHKGWLTCDIGKSQLTLHGAYTNFFGCPTENAETYFILNHSHKYQYGFVFKNNLETLAWTCYGQFNSFRQLLNVVVDGEPYGQLRHEIVEPFLGIQFNILDTDTIGWGYEWSQIYIKEGVITPDHADLLENLISNTTYDYSNIQAQFHHFFVTKRNLWGMDWMVQYSLGWSEGTIDQFSTTLFFPEDKNEIPVDIKRIDYLTLGIGKSWEITPELNFRFNVSQIIPLQIQKNSTTSSQDGLSAASTNTASENNYSHSDFFPSGGTTLRFNFCYTGFH